MPGCWLIVLNEMLARWIHLPRSTLPILGIKAQQNQIPPKDKKIKGLLKTGWWFQIFFYFHPCLGKITILKKYFSKGLKPPTRITRKENKQRSQFYFPDWKNQTEEHFVSIYFSCCFRCFLPLFSWKPQNRSFSYLRIFGLTTPSKRKGNGSSKTQIIATSLRIFNRFHP